MELSNFKKILDDYVEKYQNEVDGLWYWSSSLYFSAGLGFCALCNYYDCDIIIDSGTGKYGLSTEIFAKCFPNKQIITIDTHSYYNNEKFIKKRLKQYKNIEFIKGKSENEIPKILNNYKNKKIAIMYDGPKGKAAYELFKIHRKNKNVLFAGFDDCGGSNKYTINSYNFMKSTNEVLCWNDEDWYYEKYGYLDKNRYFVNDNNDSPTFYEDHPYDKSYPKGLGSCFIIN